MHSCAGAPARWRVRPSTTRAARAGSEAIEPSSPGRTVAPTGGTPRRRRRATLVPLTLAQRLLLTIGLLTLATTAVLGAGVRAAWRGAEEERFRAQFEVAMRRLDSELSAEVRELPDLLRPLCAHDPVLDAALVTLATGTLDPGRRLALSLRVPELMRAVRLDDLTLLMPRGEVLGSGTAAGLSGSVDAALAAELRGPATEARLRRSPRGALELVAHCIKGTASVGLGLVGVRRLGPMLRRVGEAQGLALSVSRPTDATSLLVGTTRLPRWPDASVIATRSRVPLDAALAQLDRTVLAVGGGRWLRRCSWRSGSPGAWRGRSSVSRKKPVG